MRTLGEGRIGGRAAGGWIASAPTRPPCTRSSGTGLLPNRPANPPAKAKRVVSWGRSGGTCVTFARFGGLASQTSCGGGPTVPVA